MTKKQTKPVAKTRGGIVFNDPHLTKQDHGRMADINYIAQQYASGKLPYPEIPPPFYGDVSKIDVQESMIQVAAVETALAELPSEARDFFEEKPENYVGWLEENAAEIDSRGLKRVLWDAVNGDPVDEEVSIETDSAQSAEKVDATVPESGTE